MDDLCTTCLCSGRSLYFLEDTAYYHMYLQIFNELQPEMRVRICWECRALLRRFQQFRGQARRCHQLLTEHGTPKYALCQPPRLSVHQVTATSYPLDVKVEPTETIVEIIDNIKIEVDDAIVEHCEPETFVNELDLNKTENREKTEDLKKPSKKKKKKIKGNKKKKKKLEEPLSDGFSDRECDFKIDIVDNFDNIRNTANIDKATNNVDNFDNAAHNFDNIDNYDNVEKPEEKVIEAKCMCSQCGLTFDTKKQMDLHVKKDHLKGEGVNEKVRTRSKEVLAEKPTCAECGKVFSSRKTYRYHLNVLHKGQNRYPCPRCGKVYQWKSNLGRHLRTHKARDDGELYCELCDKRFASVATYRQHLRVSRRHVSESEFSFVCNDCGKKFVNKTRLRDHVDWEHLKKIKFRCQLCNKPFKCHTSLYVHLQNVHRNKEKKDNLCHVCGKSYQNAAKLKYHIVAMHTRETPYQCGQCGAAFGWYSSLYRHIREVHYKMKVQPKKAKKGKKIEDMDIMPMPGPA
ncbi:zinc finger protein 184-like [Leguminivora glycinivorella]|uniref:zinc finger protein 184-like n=1 Tax=Leguminivora glycinivorella TaxID=1035111 RepID=UPI002010C594|nr:zinc finger protein 184-like [Leguminivora glycinivorella]